MISFFSCLTLAQENNVELQSNISISPEISYLLNSKANMLELGVLRLQVLYENFLLADTIEQTEINSYVSTLPTEKSKNIARKFFEKNIRPGIAFNYDNKNQKFVLLFFSIFPQQAFKSVTPDKVKALCDTNIRMLKLFVPHPGEYFVHIVNSDSIDQSALINSIEDKIVIYGVYPFNNCSEKERTNKSCYTNITCTSNFKSKEIKIMENYENTLIDKAMDAQKATLEALPIL
jgi:hypothetical protein